MKIHITGQKINIGSALQTHVDESLPNTLEKYAPKITSVHVNFSQVKGNLFFCQIVINLGTGKGSVIKSSGSSYNIYASFDEGLEKAKKQIVKFKDKIEDHQKMSSEERDEILLDNAQKYVIESEEEIKRDNPVIISEKPTTVQRLTVAQAVSQMQILDLPALMFVEKKSGNICVVYNRKDGNISWVDSKIKA
jgi:ribosomal subunit interface protein